MKKLVPFLILFLMALVSVPSFAVSTMSDRQVLEYVKKGLASGKSQKALLSELAARGVDRAQAERVKKMYQSEMEGKSESSNSSSGVNRQRGKRIGKNEIKNGRLSNSNNDSNEAWTPETLNDSAFFSGPAIDDNTAFSVEADSVFGRDIFKNRDLTFEPSLNLATPRNYKLGPGDEVIIDIYGANQATIQDVISSEGSINIEVLGPVYLSGKTVDEANAFLRKKLSTIYAGLDNEESKTEMVLSLGETRSITINVLGEVNVPGTYTLSGFASAFHALYSAGGIKDPGSIRKIKVTRRGKTISTIDAYDFIMNGNSQSNIRLEDGDAVIVPAYTNLVKLDGQVKRPMYFEMKEGETMQNLLDYAGGFSKGAYTQNITVIRQGATNYEVLSVESSEYNTFKIKEGDEVTVSKLLERYQNRINLRGAVVQPGIYQLSTKLYSVKTLIDRAGGLQPEAFTSRAVLHREKNDRSLEVVSVDLRGILNGTTQDIILKNNDELFIPSINDMKEYETVQIRGEVANPGMYPYADNTTLEDLVMMAGGLNAGASYARVDISRRITDQNGTEANNEISKIYTFALKEGFVIDGTPGFVLEPYDEVIVRSSPSYTTQKFVSVRGEANFTGDFAMTERDERLSELVKQAGGITKFAYAEGARLVRRMTDTERKQMEAVLNMAKQGRDSIALSDKELGNEYYVAIELDKALENPGSHYDLVLREGDRLEIPTYSNIVRVSGAVQSPNAITYRPNENYKHYIEEAGGFAYRARKRHAYVIHMNGHISKARKGKIEPGSEIIVPSKEGQSLGLQGILSIATTSASLATMIASIANILK